MSQHTSQAIHFPVHYVRFEAVSYNDVPVLTIGVDREHGVPPALSTEVLSIQLHGTPTVVVEEFIDPLIAQLQHLRADLLVEAATVPHD